MMVKAEVVNPEAAEARVTSYRAAVGEALVQEMERDPNVILLGEDVGGGGGAAGFEEKGAWGGVMGVTRGLVERFGRSRVVDTPISEMGYVGAAVGAAATGLRPVAELMFIDFMGECLDQIYNQAAKLRYMFGGQLRVPIVIRTMYGAGMRAAAQHSTSHYSVLTHFPGIKTVAPSTPRDAKGLLAAAIRDDDPVVFAEHKLLYGLRGEVPTEPYVIPLGTAEVKRPGEHVTVVGIGRMVHRALEAANTLAEEGVEVEVVDPRTLSPLDEGTILESVHKTGKLVVVDEDNPRCSVARDIVASVASQAFGDLTAPPGMVNAPHSPVPFAPVLEDAYVPSAAAVVDAVRAVLA